MSASSTTSLDGDRTAKPHDKKPEKLLGEHHETAYSMIADENLGSRDLNDLPRKMALEEELNEEDINLMLQIAKERYYYLDEQKYFDLAQKLEEVLQDEN